MSTLTYQEHINIVNINIVDTLLILPTLDLNNLHLRPITIIFT